MKTILASNRQDWFYILLSPLAGFLLILFYLIALKLTNNTIASLVTFVLYAIFFDVRHLFATYTRTILDKQYYAANKRWLINSILLVVLLPILCLLFLSIGDHYAFKSGAVFTFLFRLTTILGFYHLIKQNWGFVAIYRKKAGEPKDRSEQWEKILLLTGSFLPFTIISYQQPVWFPAEKFYLMPELHLVPLLKQIWLNISLCSLIIGIALLLMSRMTIQKNEVKQVLKNIGLVLIFSFAMTLGLVKFGLVLLFYLVVGNILAFIIALTMALYHTAKKTFNFKKWTMILSTFILYFGIILLPLNNKLMIIIAITIPHNIQYLQFVKLFNKRQYTKSTAEHGWASRLAQSSFLFFGLSFLYSLLYEISRTGTSLLLEGNQSEMIYLIGKIIGTFFLGLSLHHYFIDAIIWRVNSDKEISRYL